MSNIETLFSGGYPSPLINNLKAANCGKHIKVDNEFYEVMGSTISTHPTNIISKYIKTPTGKIEVSCWLKEDSIDYEDAFFGIAYYRDTLDTESFRYTQNIPNKYLYLKEELIKIHKLVFNGKFGIKK